MENCTASTEQNETSGSKKSASKEPSRQATLTWTLQRLNRTWFISPLDDHIEAVRQQLAQAMNRLAQVCPSRGVRARVEERVEQFLARNELR